MSENQPRWEIAIRPHGSEAQYAIVANEGGVTLAEVLYYLLRTASAISIPDRLGSVIPTADEVRQERARQELLKEHPAERLFVKDGKQLWLSGGALESYFDSTGEEYTSVEPGEPVEGALATLKQLLSEKGWVDAGPAPEGVVRACDYAQDPAAVVALL